MNSRTTQPQNPIAVIGRSTGVAFCLAWLFITNNKMVNFMKHKEDQKHVDENPLGLKELKLHELGYKYLRSCR